MEEPDVSVLFLPSHAGEGYSVNGTAVLERGAPMVWFVFPDQWASVARFHLADGTFTGFYTNLCTPVERDGKRWSSTDLFLDLWIPAKGKPRWLDEDELAEAIAGKVLDKWTAERIKRERERLEVLLEAGAWPPVVCHQTDLAFIRTTMHESDDT
ncbi:MAG: DUF402 domain-containing protein [Gemmatimonadetes bacterium]|nr:DUF402 domain-containing protein [Gemmatimonadota bacterium]